MVVEVVICVIWKCLVKIVIKCFNLVLINFIMVFLYVNRFILVVFNGENKKNFCEEFFCFFSCVLFFDDFVYFFILLCVIGIGIVYWLLNCIELVCNFVRVVFVF